MYKYDVFNIDFFFNDTATTEIYTLSLHDALPISKKMGNNIFWDNSFFLFYTSFSYDFYRYAVNNFDSTLAPAILGNKTPPIRTNDEKLQIIAVSLSLSAVLAFIDYLLGKPWND